jgi:hypothetical protein
MDARRSLVSVFCLIAAVVAATPAGAATLTYDLTGDPSNLVDVPPTPGDPTVGHHLFLTDATTGLGQIPAVTVSVGDTIDATVTLNSALTMPASNPGAELALFLGRIPDNMEIDYSESITYYNGGVQVMAPFNGTIVGTQGSFGLGQSQDLVATPDFSFDKIVYSATLSDIFDFDGSQLTQTTLAEANPHLTVITVPSPLPLPGAFELLLSGAGGLGVLARMIPGRSRRGNV